MNHFFLIFAILPFIHYMFVKKWVKNKKNILEFSYIVPFLPEQNQRKAGASFLGSACFIFFCHFPKLQLEYEELPIIPSQGWHYRMVVACRTFNYGIGISNPPFPHKKSRALATSRRCATQTTKINNKVQKTPYRSSAILHHLSPYGPQFGTNLTELFTGSSSLAYNLPQRGEF